MRKKNNFDAVGVMSGTSLDGLDIALCRFHVNKNNIKGKIIKALTIKYTPERKDKLSNAHKLPFPDFCILHNEYGKFIGTEVKKVLNKYYFNPVCIASHGHTVMHNPLKKLTVQVGNGAYIAAETNIDTVSDFRTLDVALCGNGAPLVSTGDMHLFSEYESCLNLGGFSNITILKGKQPVAFDICPVNIILNMLSQREGVDFDKHGLLAKKGNLILPLLTELENIKYYHQAKPVSLSREWTEQYILPKINKRTEQTSDLLKTFVLHIASRISYVLNKYTLKNCLVTGGGAFNKFLIENIKNKTETELIIPDNTLVKYKEALIFAFLGLKRLQSQINVMSVFTNAKTDTSSGVIWKINKD